MRLRDLRPDEYFPQPSLGSCNGQDAELFRSYRQMVENGEQECSFEAERVAVTASTEIPAGVIDTRFLLAREQATAEAAEAARLAFMTGEAQTLEGVLLKLEYSIAGQPMLDGEQVTDFPGFVYSAIEDLRRMIRRTDAAA